MTLKEGQSPERVADDHRRNEGAQVDHVYRHALRGYAARMGESAAARVARDNRVASVEPDRVVTIAKPAGKPGGVRPGVNCIRNGTTDDGNGHGTHVAGTIGAIGDGVGVVGVAPGARPWAVRVLDNRGSGTTSSVICGVDWVEQNAAIIDVANMSLGGGGNEPAGAGCSTGNAYHDAVCTAVAAGITFVATAGNSAADAKGIKDQLQAAGTFAWDGKALNADGTFQDRDGVQEKLDVSTL